MSCAFRAQTVGEVQRDDPLPQQVVHRLSVAQVDPERENGEQLAQVRPCAIHVGKVSSPLESATSRHTLNAIGTKLRTGIQVDECHHGHRPTLAAATNSGLAATSEGQQAPLDSGKEHCWAARRDRSSDHGAKLSGELIPSNADSRFPSKFNTLPGVWSDGSFGLNPTANQPYRPWLQCRCTGYLARWREVAARGPDPATSGRSVGDKPQW